MTMEQSQLPTGWDAEHVRRVMDHYESQSEDEALIEDESSFAQPGETVMEVPRELVSAIRELIARFRAA